MKTFAWISDDGQSELWLGDAKTADEARTEIERVTGASLDSGEVYEAISDDGGESWSRA